MLTSIFTKNPVVGTRLTPALIRNINAAIRRNQPIAGKGVTLTRTAGGTIINSTARGGNVIALPKVDKGCFAIRTIISVKGEDIESAYNRYMAGEEIPEGSETEERDCLFNRYVWCGSQMYELPVIEVGTEEFKDKILSIEVRSGGEIGQEGEYNYALTSSIAALNYNASLQGLIVIPLYSFNSEAEMDVDFRNIPRGDAWAVVV